MGQALVTMSPSRVVEGEIEVCPEATVLLDSLEEHRTEVLKISPSREVEPFHREEEKKEDRVKRALGLCDFYETDMENATSFDQTHEHLADVLYAVFYLSLPTGSLQEYVGELDLRERGAASRYSFQGPSRRWSISSSMIRDEGGSGCGVLLGREELQKALKKVFQVEDDTTFDMMLQDVRRREQPKVILHLHIIEAKDLRPRTSKGTTHSYCSVKVCGSEEDPYKTEVAYNTTAPFWDAPFHIEIPDSKERKLTVEIWHEPQESGMEQLAAIRDFTELGRAVLGKNEFKNLLGTVTISLESIKNKLTDDWYPIIKKEELKTVSIRESFRGNKKRGSLHLSMKASVKSQLNLLGCHWYDALLNKVIQYHLGFHCFLDPFPRDNSRCSTRSTRSSISTTQAKSILKKESDSSSSCIALWDGTLTNVESFILSQYGAVLNMTSARITLAWWTTTSKLLVVDQSYLGQLLKKLYDSIHKEQYSEEESKDAQSSLKLWVACQEERLKNLHTYYPISSRVISHHQLTNSLRNMKDIEANEKKHNLNVIPKGATVSMMVTSAITKFTMNWWEKTLQNCDHNTPNASDEQQLEAVASVTGEVLQFLRHVCNFYEAIFKNEADVSYLKLSYNLLTSELAARIRPLLLKLYENPMKSKSDQSTQSRNISLPSHIHAMDERGPIWQLYKKLESITVEIGGKLPEDAKQLSGIAGYHSWFLKVILRWQELMLTRAKSLVIEEVEKDTFEVENANSSLISASATEVTFIFQIVKVTWIKLSWPHEVDGDVIAKKLLESLCNIGKHYSKLIINKLNNELAEDEVCEDNFFPVETCVALNNIEHVRQEINGLPALLQLCEENGNTYQWATIEKTQKLMETHVVRFIEASVKRIKPALTEAAVTSCDTGSAIPLLNEALDGELCHLKRHLNETNLRRVLSNLWNTIIYIFLDVVKSKSNKREAEYFNGAHRILNNLFQFFTPNDQSGLDPQLAHTPDYQTLMNDLSNLKMDTEMLIAKYYRERYEEQKKQDEQQKRVTSTAPELIVCVYFTKKGRLHIEVIMARNINEIGNLQGVPSPFSRKTVSLKPPNSYVQIKVIPNDSLPTLIHKTKTQRDFSPVFQDNIEFHIICLPNSHMYGNDYSVRGGHLLFTLKSAQLVQADGFLGEAILPLDNVKWKEATDAEAIQNICLSVTKPKDDDCYVALKALKFRTWDKKASIFLKELKELMKRRSNIS